MSAAASMLASSSLAAAATGAPMAMLDAGAGGSEVSAVGSDMAMAQMRAGGLVGLALLGRRRLPRCGTAVSDCDAVIDEGGIGGFGGGAAALLSGAALSIDEALGALVAGTIFFFRCLCGLGVCLCSHPVADLIDPARRRHRDPISLFSSIRALHPTPSARGLYAPACARAPTRTVPPPTHNILRFWSSLFHSSLMKR